MIHLVLPEPIQYQRTLCQALNDHFDGSFMAWFANGEPSVAEENFRSEFLTEGSYRRLFRALRNDREAVLVIGGWSSNAAPALLIAGLLRLPFFIWADHPFPRKRNPVFAQLRKTYLKILSAYASGFLGCGESTVRHLASLGVPNEKLFNFPYWVALPGTWSPIGTSARDETPLQLLAVGRLVSVKAFDVGIKAVAQANRKAGNVVANLTVIGDGPERESLESLCKSLGAEGFISFSGWLPNDSIYQQLVQSDALIVPSEFEPYGVVVLEAMANGRAVLASDQVIAALDRNENNGAIFLHAAGDVEALSSQITELAMSPELLAAGSRAARATAEKWPPQRAGVILTKAIDASTNPVLPATPLTRGSETSR